MPLLDITHYPLNLEELPRETLHHIWEQQDNLLGTEPSTKVNTFLNFDPKINPKMELKVLCAMIHQRQTYILANADGREEAWKEATEYYEECTCDQCKEMDSSTTGTTPLFTDPVHVIGDPIHRAFVSQTAEFLLMHPQHREYIFQLLRNDHVVGKDFANS
ncbi:hypothetical protein [Vibrio harveyi]|uniref:hypothetical protein n=1 Tax=Vibrio harveyi TaxID=669 RepID=UPI00390C074A